ncbi:MAG TPA: hypothetical protein DCM40_08485, partial [Maribacter sp.]|nr:hypothetical protein [Maribacter sp.]
TSSGMLFSAIKQFGLEFKSTQHGSSGSYHKLHKDDKYLTLGSFINSRKVGDKNFYLISARNHWQIIQGHRYVCGQSSKVGSIFGNKYCEWGCSLDAVYLIHGDVKMSDELKHKIELYEAGHPYDVVHNKVSRLLRKHGYKFADVFDFGYEYGDDKNYWKEQFNSNSSVM